MPPPRVEDILDLEDVTPQAAAPTHAPSFLERLGGLKGALATGVRGLTGLGPGGVPGAAIAGIGELAAEQIEDFGSKPNLARIATEATLGAVPLGKLLKAGRPISAALKGGALGAVGTGARELAAGEELDPKAMLESAALSGLTGGATSKLMGYLGGATKAAPSFANKAEYEAWKAAQAAKPALPSPVVTEEAGTRAFRMPKPAAGPRPVQPSPKDVSTFQDLVSGELGKRLGKVPTATEKLSDLDKAIATAKKEASAARGASFRREMAGQRAETVADLQSMRQRIAEEAKAAKEAQKLAEQEAAQADIEAAKEGLVAKPPTITETVSAPGQRMVTKYARPQAEEAIGEALPPAQGPQPQVAAPEATSTPAPIVEAQPPAPAIEPLPGPKEPPEAALLKFFRTPQGAAGYNYRLAQEAAGAGEIPTAEYAREARMRTVAPEEPSPIGLSPAQIEQDLADAAVMQAKKGVAVDPEKLDALRNVLKGERGAANPELLMRLGLGVGGALLGGATDPLGNPLASAAAGGLLGAAAPSIIPHLKSLGMPDEAAQAIAQEPTSIGDKAKKIFEMLPQIMRFNYLADPFVPGTPIPAGGLVANAFAGPYGADVMGALEKGLSGDPRGWEMLRTLMNPATFAKEYVKSVPEAVQRIGRAEGRPLSAAATTGEKILAAPGTYMTAGDIASQNIGTQHGFSPEEMRRMTLTAEPELKFTKRIAEFPKANPLGQLLFPFSRTPANILEQGSMRIPGLGELVQSYRATPDDPRTRLVQQGLGALVGAGSMAAGANIDPESASLPRRYITNMAGTYSLPAALGFAMGQALQKGEAPIKGLTKEMEYAFPLPTTEPIRETGTALQQLLSGEEVTTPRWAYPAFIRNAPEMSFPTAGPASTAAPAGPTGDIEDFLDLSDLPRR